MTGYSPTEMADRDDDITLYDIDPAFQNRLLKWLTKYDAVVEVAANEKGEFVITVDSLQARAGLTTAEGGVWSRLVDALESLMSPRAKFGAPDPTVLNMEFERRVADWLHAHNAHLTFGATGKEFVVSVASAGGRGEATDIDFEVALAIAEDEWAEGVVQAVSLDELEAETLAMPTRHVPPREAIDIEPETLAAPTRLFDRAGELDVTLPSPTMTANKKWTKAHVDRLPDTAFLYVEPGGEKHDRRTHPLSLRHFPYKNEHGGIDYAHLKNALGRISQSALPETAKRQTKAKAEAIFEREFARNARHPMLSMARGQRPHAQQRLSSDEIRVLSTVKSGGDLGTSVVTGRRLGELRDRGLVEMTQSEPGYSSLTDHWEVTPSGHQALAAEWYARNPRTPPPPPPPRRHGAFDPAAPRAHYARPHHFAVNDDTYSDWVAEVADQLGPGYDSVSREWLRHCFAAGLSPDEVATEARAPTGAAG